MSFHPPLVFPTETGKNDLLRADNMNLEGSQSVLQPHPYLPSRAQGSLLDVAMSDTGDSDMYTDCFESIPDDGASVTTKETKESTASNVVNTQDQRSHTFTIPGMFLVLDLISEEGSGGLVDKVIIAQQSLAQLLNEIAPGSYTSLTKVDFSALDEYPIHPLGIYGSKTSLVSFLAELGVIDSDIASSLLVNDDPHKGLKSGLYVVRPSETLGKTFLIYWPEKGTWDARPPTGPHKNRVTFMRYLTKLADQLVCLISPGDAQSIVWADSTSLPVEGDSDDDDDDDDDSDERLFSFEVTKTDEQAQNVTCRAGFEMACQSFGTRPLAPPGQPPLKQPYLIPGETSQGLLISEYQAARTTTQHISKQTFTEYRLRDLLNKSQISLSPNITEEGLQFLLNSGLKDRCPNIATELTKRNGASRKGIDERKAEEMKALEESLRSHRDARCRTLREELLRIVLERYRFWHEEILGEFPDVSSIDSLDSYNELIANFPLLKDEVAKALPPKILGSFPKSCTLLKEKLILADEVSKRKNFKSVAEKEDILRHCLQLGLVKVNPESHASSYAGAFAKGFATMVGLGRMFESGSDEHKEIAQIVKTRAKSTSDLVFCSQIAEMASREPYLQQSILDFKEHAFQHLCSLIQKAHARLLVWFDAEQRKILTEQLNNKYSSQLQEELSKSRGHFFSGVASMTTGKSNALFDIQQVNPNYSRYGGRPVDCTLSGQVMSQTDASLEIKIVPFGLSTHDGHQLSLDPQFIPTPVEMAPRFRTQFDLHPDDNIRLIQLVGGNKCLVVVENHNTLHIYLDELSSLPGAIKYKRSRRQLHREKLGGDVHIAYDEARRLLGVCSVVRPCLLLFSFTEDYRALNSWGSPLELVSSFNDGVQILSMCFVLGSDEVLLITHENHARIFSLISRQFRPGSVQLPAKPSALHPSVDGACLFVSLEGDDNHIIAYHWDTFGSSNEGIMIDVSGVPSDSRIMTSIGPRSNVFLMGLDLETRTCKSVLLDITKKSTNFKFLSKSHRRQIAEDSTTCNPFIDCLTEVWRRFPVVPTVKRHTTLAVKEQRRITFVAQSHQEEFLPYFQDAMQSFEQQTRKPTGKILVSTAIDVTDMTTFISELPLLAVSRLRTGEWITDMLCLIPIHIAVAKENRFIPLQDGVVSRELEQSLLGADVRRVMESISFGWYESIFRSYHSTKPVKVVSSMGEQSVGKSFALNHLADTSFAGSAMRTTGMYALPWSLILLDGAAAEGVWMSVTPTEDLLLVALDFEGVHSIERSAQEDTLLVLFNTAISNLVLFRNNFALSRDITGLFQSFQASTNVLNPAANPSLFQSRLAIIIKDVVESDTAEIVREFQLKFHNIVEEEQDSNFISKLHAGQLDIIPWPVIESKQFYTLFSKIKKRLDKQPPTHQSAGEFLQVMKTLMAKLKTNDWGAMSHTMATHRAEWILSILSTALASGHSEDYPEIVPLKNFDTDVPIAGEDTDAFFVIGEYNRGVEQPETHLQALQRKWSGADERQLQDELSWIEGLVGHISHVVDLRITRVKSWIDTNLSRFLEGQRLDVVLEVYRRFDTLTMELKMSAQLCKLQCAGCSLSCLKRRGHDISSDGGHDCFTSHRCIHACEFEEHTTEAECGYPAGHTGKHICSVEAHLCGEKCKFDGKRGCLGACIKEVNHSDDDEHLCSSRLHACGEPCSLIGIHVPGGSRNTFTCHGRCTMSLDHLHDEHICEVASCPIRCQLCQRLCSSSNHLHALQPDAVHLCGQSHACSANCAANGICEIETAPQSIEATFTGRNETFQYTKYSQVAKRAKCVVPIPPGEIAHTGQHSHSMGLDVFHFCEAQCGYCGYYCTLPLGHAQQEHTTEHGSMSRTHWAVEGPDTNIIEVDGRKFSAQDDGAPMLCSLVCTSLGRHTHIDFCRSDDPSTCSDHTDISHIGERMLPDPDRAKDFISHSLHWRRCGFKDPYSRDAQVNFSKCDAMCSGPEHSSTASTTAQPSFCTLPIFHPPATVAQLTGLGYISNDGHLFSCKNPSVMQQAFHVVFVIDRSGSMDDRDRRPLNGTPVTQRIANVANNRLGAVYSSLHAFWTSRHASQGQAARRDAYSVILFDHECSVPVQNDFANSPDDLLAELLQFYARGGTDYTAAVQEAQRIIEGSWSAERFPVVIFLSDGECSVEDAVVSDLCRACVALGKPLSFHSVAFGPSNGVLRRMAHLAADIERTAPADPLLPANARIESSYSEALDSVRLAETFLGFAESMRKTRGSLIH